MPQLRSLFRVLAIGAVFCSAAPAFADEKPKDDKAAQTSESAKVQSFADALKAKDPEAYKRFTELRETRDKALDKLKKTQEELKKAAGEEKINLYQEFKENRKAYATSYMAFLDFLDERDRKRLTTIEERIKENLKSLEQAKEQINGVLASRKKAREELEAALKD